MCEEKWKGGEKRGGPSGESGREGCVRRSGKGVRSEEGPVGRVERGWAVKGGGGARGSSELGGPQETERRNKLLQK